jgi:hypothetical protein
MVLTVQEAYYRASVVIGLLVEEKIKPATAKFRLDEINDAAKVNLRCDLPYLQELRTQHQSTAVFSRMRDDDNSDYDSSEDTYDDSSN